MDLLQPSADHTLRLPRQGVSLAAPGHLTLLQAMHRAGIDWPSSCRNGTCRACIGHLTAGSVRHGVDWPGLLPEEKATGAVLPCVAYPLGDVTLLPGPG